MDIHALFSLKGKTAVVTGASGALGGAAVRAMAYAGANVAACYNSGRERLDTLISEIGDVGVEIKPYKVNSFSQDEIRQHAEDVMRDFGGIDVVINTAGGNVKGAYYTDEQSLFDLDAQPQFDTVTLNLFGGCFWPCLRDFNPKLRVNAVAPGFFPNNNPAQMLFNPDGSYRAKAQRGVDATPMHRMGHPNELIGTLVWLASDASSYVTGITVTVDGGYLLDSPA